MRRIKGPTKAHLAGAEGVYGCWETPRGHLCCPHSALRKLRPGEREREPFLRKYPGVILDPGIQSGAHCWSSPQGLKAVATHLGALSSSSWNPCPCWALFVSPSLFCSEACQAAIWNGKAADRASSLEPTASPAKVLGNGLALPVPVAAGHGFGQGRLVPVSHFGNCGWLIAGSYSAVKHAPVPWLGNGQREHIRSPS